MITRAAIFDAEVEYQQLKYQLAAYAKPTNEKLNLLFKAFEPQTPGYPPQRR